MSVMVTETFQGSCDQPSDHILQFTNCISVTDPHVIDPDTSNNCQNSEVLIVITASADLKISSQTIDAPTSTEVGVPFTVTVDKTVHNNGPLSPAPATVSTTASAPPDCTVVPDPGNPTTLNLTASVSQDIAEVFTVTCSDPSFHVISVENCIAASDPHLTDPDVSNNCETSNVTVSVSAEADLKITSQVFKADDCIADAPILLPPGVDLDICLVTTVHNNGPLTPVDADLDITVTPPAVPAGCTATPSPVSSAVNGLQTSVVQAVQQIFTLHCAAGGLHHFEFDSALVPINVHIDDPVAPNHLVTEVFEILSEEADPKITAVVVDCPDGALTGQTFQCDVDVTVHNNGPASPVGVDVQTDLTPPFDCNVSPGTQTSPQSLVASTSQVVTFTWDVVCSDYSFHTFVADSELIVTHPGLLELDPSNNSGTGQNTTSVDQEIDVKVTGISATAPATVATNTDFTIDVHVSLHNNGPASPIKIEGGHGISVSPDCTIAPDVSQLFNITSLPVSTTEVVTKTFTINCSGNGEHTFVICGRASPDTLHVAEASTFNNHESDPIVVNVGGNTPLDAPTVSCSIRGHPPEVCGDGIDNDGDTEIDEEPDTDLDGVNDCDDPDDDNDGFTDVIENHVGTDPLNHCPRGPFDSAWPPDFFNDRKVDIFDILAMKASFGSSSGDANFDVRRDLTGDGAINIFDVLRVKPFFGQSCT